MEKPKIRFRKFNNKWKKNKLDKVVDFFDNQRIPIDSSERKSGLYPYYGASGIIDYVDGYIFSGEYVLLAEDGANIILRSSPIAYLSKGKFWLNNHAHIMRMKTGSNEFLVQLLEKQNYEKYNTGTAQPKLNGEVVKNITLHFPSDDEQSAIGSIFRTLDDLLSSYKDNLANYQSLKETMLSKMFPKAGQTVPEIRLDGFEGEWELYELKSRAETITKGTTPKDKSWQGEVNYIKTESINRDTGSLVRTASTSLEEHLGYLKRSILKEGDVLFSIVGTLGVVGIVDKKDLPANTNQQIAIIRLKRDDAIFMLNFLKSPRIKSFIKSDSTIGAQPSLSLWQIEKIKVSLPPSLEEQQAIGAYFSNLDNLINSHQEKISQLETLKKKLLQDMFI